MSRSYPLAFFHGKGDLLIAALMEDCVMREKVSMMFLLCCLLATVAAAEEITPPTAGTQTQVPELQIPFAGLLPMIGGQEAVPVAAGGVENGGGCTAKCNDGTTVSCPPGTSTCSKQDSNCGGSPSHRGFVTCGPFTIWCEATCECNTCPDVLGCNYEYHTGTGPGTGCCVDSQDPVNCPDICE